ncbi:uncharacterized protein LOC135961242 [Calliphora vicina]|uniref:uncharacterized protein LOC135961242 n=1 Tax=Calliphora vicina TaxID=7373 RepID=UPI00325AE73B
MGGGKKQKSSTSLESLYQQKNKILNNVSRIRRSIKEKTISFNQNELHCRLEILNSYIEDVMDIQTEIDILDPSNDERSDLENLCVSTKSMLLGYLTPREHSIAETTLGFSSHHSRLPSMKLPKFSGKYAEYKNFISLFESLVDSDITLTEIEKFNHLISCLSDEALGTVKAYQISEQNYSKALQSLKRVYDNPCLIFFDNITKLFDLPEMSKPSATSLRSMIDTVSAIYGSLLSIGDDKAITNAIIIHLVMTKVDPITRSKWEEQLDYEKLPLWSDCEVALNKRYQHISAEEASSSRLKPNTNFTRKNESFSKKKKSSFSCQTDNQQSVAKCLFCKAAHYLSNCPSFSAVPVQQRFDFVKGVPACINCLKKGHTVTKCKSTKCRVCSGSHHTLLHKYAANDAQPENVANSDPNVASTSRAFVNHSSSAKDNVILATALVQIKNKSGQYVLARALLDSGSQINFVTEELSQRLQLQKQERNLSLIGIGRTNSSAKHKLQATVKSRMNSHEFSAEFWILRSISNYQPDRIISTAGWNLPDNIEFADPYFNKPQRIDMLIGAEIFFELLCVGQIKLNPNIPTLQKTLLGWIVSGKYKELKHFNKNVCHLSSLTENEDSLDSIVRRFWELEEIPREANVLSIEHQECEKSFSKSVQRLPSGRFKVALPFKADPNTLGLSFETARRRFLSLERRLSKEPQTKEMYNSFMKEYINLGHMSIADNKVPDVSHYFIPHQCVLRPQSSTTKLRVVFDASCKTSTQLSLNDLLMIGPTIQEELYSTLLRFRMHKYAITADIEKMYRQVLIDEADRNYQLILWRENQSQNIEIYKLNTVTYGTSSAPFLAIRCLTYVSELFEKSLPIGSKVIKRDFYVDDLLTGADSIEDLNIIRSQVTQILQSAGFNLTKWFSNCYDQDSITIQKSVQINQDFTKTLGTYWIPKSDVFKYHLDDLFQNLKATKRNILSVSARLFDPLGLLCPLIIKAKILLQELWLMQLDWDESIPTRLDTSFTDFKANLLKIDIIEIPRFVLTSSNTECQIHGFSDASMRAYGCCIYIRSRASGKTSCRLLTAKSKVAPLKTKSLPRLELCAAHLLSKLWSKIKHTILFKVENVTFWTDSEITLHWIQTHPSTLATFVSNRVSEIQELSGQATWRHVPTKENPADIVSRGCNVEELVDSVWFNGPKFLLEETNMWPVNEHFELTPEQKSLETRKTNVFLAVEENEINPIAKIIESYSSYNKMIRVFSYVFRFLDIARGKQFRNIGIPTAKEINWTFLQLIEFIQKREYAEELKKLSKSQVLPSNLQRLNPFVHQYKDEYRSFSLLRVGGRLLNAPIDHDAKFPLLMPKKSYFMVLYLRHLHLEHCHAGAKALVAILRDKIWLINAREACSRVVRKCIHCFRYKPKLMNQIMGNLPADRVRRQERAPRARIQRQRNEFCRCQSRAAPAQRSNGQQCRRHENVRCQQRNRLCLHSSSSSTFRRSVGSGRQIRQNTSNQNRRQGAVDGRGITNGSGSNRGSPELQTDRSHQQRSQRRRSVNSSASTIRREPSSAAARIASRRSGQAEVLQEMAAYLHSQADVLAILGERLRPQPPSQNQVGGRRARSRRRQARRRSRRQHGTPEVADRPSIGGNPRRGRQSESSGSED